MHILYIYIVFYVFIYGQCRNPQYGGSGGTGAVTMYIYIYSIPYGQFLGTRFSLEHFFYGTLYGNDVNLRNSMGYIYNMYICQFFWFSRLIISLPLAEHVIHLFAMSLFHLKGPLQPV